MLCNQSRNSNSGSRWGKPESMRPSILLSLFTTVQVQHPKREEPVPHDGAEDWSMTRGHSPPSALRYSVTRSRCVPPHGAGRCNKICQTSPVLRSTMGLNTKQPFNSVCGCNLLPLEYFAIVWARTIDSSDLTPKTRTTSPKALTSSKMYFEVG